MTTSTTPPRRARPGRGPTRCARLARAARAALALGAAALSGAISPGAVAEPIELDVLTWSEYLDPEVVAEFERDYGVRLDLEYFDADEERDRRLSERGGTGHDLLMVNGEQIERYAARGWLEPIDPARVPNAVRVDARWRDAYPGTDRHGVAYFWGTLGIAWRSDLWPEGFASWRSLLAPDPALEGRLAMTGDGRELVAMALKAAGHSANAGDAAPIAEAAALLEAQRPFVAGYGYGSLDARNPLVTGEAVAMPMYNGDALVVAELEPGIEFALPEEGGLLWVDYWAISSTSTKKALAAAFVDFLNRPDIAARNAEALSYVSPLAEARALAPDGAGTGPVLNPGAEALGRAEFLRALPPRGRKRVNTVAAQILGSP